MDKKIIGYKSPTDLYNGHIKKDMVFIKGLTGIYYPDQKSPINDTYRLPAEIVERWEPVFEEDIFKVNDWVFSLLTETTHQICKINDNGSLSSNVGILWPRCCRLATRPEILAHLREEAEKKGIVVGAKVIHAKSIYVIKEFLLNIKDELYFSLVKKELTGHSSDHAYKLCADIVLYKEPNFNYTKLVESHKLNYLSKKGNEKLEAIKILQRIANFVNPKGWEKTFASPLDRPCCIMFYKETGKFIPYYGDNDFGAVYFKDYQTCRKVIEDNPELLKTIFNG